jgi:hypothetical protein
MPENREGGTLILIHGLYVNYMMVTLIPTVGHKTYIILTSTYILLPSRLLPLQPFGAWLYIERGGLDYAIWVPAGVAMYGRDGDGNTGLGTFYYGFICVMGLLLIILTFFFSSLTVFSLPLLHY